MSGTTAPSSPTDEMVWINTTNNTISRYNETLNSWVSVGGGNGGNANTGDITFDGVQIIGAGTAAGDGSGSGTIELVPDGDLNSDQYLIIDPTAPNHIHIRAGGTQDASTADLILGAENTNVLVSDTGDYVDIRTTSNSENTNIWRFDSSGYISGPAMGGLFVSGLLNGQGDLWLGSSDYNIILSAGSGHSAYVGDASTVDNQIAKLSDRAYVRVNVPTSSRGQVGDVANCVADDTTYHYFCTGTYDGTTHIWRRVAWTAGTWGV